MAAALQIHGWVRHWRIFYNKLGCRRGTARRSDPCLLWPNGWMDQDATWYEGSSHIVLNGNPGRHPMHTFQVVCKHICEVRVVPPLSDVSTVKCCRSSRSRGRDWGNCVNRLVTYRQSGDYVAGFCVESTYFYAVGLQLGMYILSDWTLYFRHISCAVFIILPYP